MNREFILAVLRTELLNQKALISDIEALGIALRGNLINPEQCLDHMHQMNLVGPILMDAIFSKTDSKKGQKSE
jgi:hypothetical protein